MQRVPSTVTDTSLNWEVGIVYQCTTCNKIELSFDDKLRACAIPICNGVMTESAQLVLANFRDMLISYENLPPVQWRAAHEALTPPPHNQDEHPIIASSTSSKIAAMINGMPPKTFNAIKDSSAALFYMLAIQVSTLHAELTQKPSGVVKLLKLLLELHVKSKEVIKNITEILARINLLIATTLKYKEDVTTYICICKGCNVISISGDNAPSQMPCAKTPCNKRITLLARLIDLGQNNIIVWHEITKEPNWDNAMKIVQRFPDNFQQEFAELSSIIWDCIHDNITISWKISYIISRIKIIFAILDLLPNTAQDKFLEVTNSLLHTYKELITVLSLVFIAIISIRTEAWK